MPAKKVCTVPGCPVLVPAGTTRCPSHASAAARARGTRAERGYGGEHRRLRAKWAAAVEAGEVHCRRCGLLIVPGTAWDLGHDDVDRSITRGPEHAAACNRSAAGRSAHPRP